MHPLEEYRLKNNLTLRELSSKINIDNGNLSKIISGLGGVSKTVSYRIREKLGIDIPPTRSIKISEEAEVKINKLITKRIKDGRIVMNDEGNVSLDKDLLLELQEKAFSIGENDIKHKSNAIFIGEIDSLEDSDGNTKFTEISPGRYRMKVDLVPNHARAGWLAGFEDPTYIEELPKHEITVTEFHKGKYVSFEVDGDSMFDGSIESVPDGCIITGREIARHHWNYKLHAHKYPNWVFVHRTEGVLVKRIKSQNLETGEIILLSLNPDKDVYPDRSIFLDDVYKIYNVVKRELN